MNEGRLPLGLELQSTLGRMVNLKERVLSHEPPLPELFEEAVEELSTALEQLRLVQDELRRQRQELEAAHLEALENRERYGELFQFAPFGYVVTDAWGKILEANAAAAKLLKVPAQYLVDKPLVVYLGQTDMPKFYRRLIRVQSDQKRGTWVSRLRLRTAESNGRAVYVAVTVSPIRSRTNKLVALRWSLRDVTQQKLAEKQSQRLNAELEKRVLERTAELQEANHAKDILLMAEQTARADAEAARQQLQQENQRKNDFLAMLGHELRNPLAPVLSAVQILRLKRSDPAALEWCTTVIERQARHMARLVDDLLDVSRIARGKIQLRLETTTVATVVSRAVESCQPFLKEQGHELSINLPPAPVPLVADATRLEQVLCNLLHNATKYTDRAGKIWLTAQVVDNQVELRVRDSGIGLSPELLGRVFDPFVQGQRSSERAENGLGVGLTLVRSLVELHGGRVEARSEGLGKGSEFVVRLPLASASPSAPCAEPRNGAALRVLIVEDNQDAAESLAVLLRLWGHEARLAHTGKEAFQVVEGFQPELAMLDIGLPDTDGYRLAEELRRLPGLEHLRLVAMTGYGQDEDRQRSQQAGFLGHLVKPVDPEVVQTMISRLKGAGVGNGPA
jgi:PAS domain S-box-containing protein